jgi:hypothetical protein
LGAIRLARQGGASHRRAYQPGRLVVHDDPYDIYAKLNWEANEFELKRTSPEKPIDIDGVVYLLHNACISAVSLVEWLQIAARRAGRADGRQLDEDRLRAEIELWLPNIRLARAIANTFKHGTYRDEGWGDAEIRLEILFDAEQHSRLARVQGTDAFDAVYADEAAEADFAIAFVRDQDQHQLAAGDFVLGLAHGALRLLDATYNSLESFFAPNGLHDVPVTSRCSALPASTSAFSPRSPESLRAFRP